MATFALYHLISSSTGSRRRHLLPLAPILPDVDAASRGLKRKGEDGNSVLTRDENSHGKERGPLSAHDVKTGGWEVIESKQDR